MVAASEFQGEGDEAGVGQMPSDCPECGRPWVNGLDCGCGHHERAVEAFVSGDETETWQRLKEILEIDVKAKESENKQTKKAIRELLGKKLELSTSSLGWLKTFHAHEFGAYEPKVAVKKEPEVELTEKPAKAPLLERIASVIGIFLLLGFVLAIAWRFVVLAVVIAAIVAAIFYGFVAHKYVRWLSIHIARSREAKAALADESRKLVPEIEAFRGSHAAQEEQLRLLRMRLKEVSDRLKAEAQMPSSVPDPTPKKPRGFLGLLQAAANVIPVGKCPNCQASFSEVSDGEEILDTKSVLVRSPIEKDVFEEETLVEKAITKAKRSLCSRCGHRWNLIYTEVKKVSGNCPTCYESSVVFSESEEVLKAECVVVGGGPGKNNFRGRSEIRVHQDYFKRRHCKNCDRRWRIKASRNWTLSGVCPACYADRKEMILKEKVRSRDTQQTMKKADVHIDRNFELAGQTIRQELVVIREDEWETTFQCRSCSHEWKEHESENYRVF